ncbi:MAG TPA: hypothetical protein VFG54_13690 [Prolixibacteraceae bacterium]|nr:hypothetical protein [Prolixibacteraceae bacterium]
MKNILTFIALIMCIQLMATEQEPDYLIIERDTLPIFNNPLEQYFDQINNREIPGFENPCWSTACWRGYKAYWEIRNDSLFLLKITSCVDGCKGSRDANLVKMFGSKKVFSYWYSGTLTIPRGNFFSAYSMGYSAIYENEEKVEINKGITLERYFSSNAELIKKIKLDQILSEKVSTLSDTLLYYLERSVNWEKLDNSKNRWCDDEYLLFYDHQGNLLDIELVMLHNDSTLSADRMEKYCSRRMKNSLNQLSLNYINPHKPFVAKIDLWYDEKLTIEGCGIYYEMNDAKIKKWIENQMNVRE